MLFVGNIVTFYAKLGKIFLVSLVRNCFPRRPLGTPHQNSIMSLLVL